MSLKTPMNRYSKSSHWLKLAKSLIPSASQTYSKSYRYYCEGAAPVFLDHGKGSHVWDIDGNEYIDYVMALGPITLGYNNEAVNGAIIRQLKKGILFSQPVTLEVTLAEEIKKIIPCAEMVRFVKNGSDATSAAVRLARAFTGKEMILSCGYHGMHDWYIGSTENSRGVPKGAQSLIKRFPYNRLSALEEQLQRYKNKVAAIIMEPVREEIPDPGYLKGVRRLADQHRVILIFDEVVTGFRMGISGAQGYYGVIPDLAAFGKGVANGMPLSFVTGQSRLMKLVDEGVFLSLTFGGEALSLAAALATIGELKQKNIFPHSWSLGEKLKSGTEKLISEFDVKELVSVKGLDVMPGIFFKSFKNHSANDLKTLFQQEVLKKGVLFLGVNYFCAAHTRRDIEQTLRAYRAGFEALRQLVDGRPMAELLEGLPMRPVFERNH